MEIFWRLYVRSEWAPLMSYSHEKFLATIYVAIRWRDEVPQICPHLQNRSFHKVAGLLLLMMFAKRLPCSRLAK
jgi:hypothetical protein